MNRLLELESVYKDYSIETKTEKGAYIFMWDHKWLLGISERRMESKTVSKNWMMWSNSQKKYFGG